jgi:hypothetical protein
MAVSSMLNGKHPLAALNRMTNNMTSFLKHSVYTISSHIIIKGVRLVVGRLRQPGIVTSSCVPCQLSNFDG